MKINYRSTIALIISVALAQTAGILGSIVTIDSIGTWYVGLGKPSFNPPNWIFGPVWTLLYTLMGISAWLLWSKRKQPEVRKILWLYGSHLAVNTLWSFVFFGWHRLDLAFLVIIILWTMIACLILLIKRYSLIAAWLLLPYLLWVSFATLLNYSLWQLNSL